MEQLKHECGVAMIRLLKPLEYYEQKYGTWRYGLNKLYLMMEKQHNRGQEGAGAACVNMDAPHTAKTVIISSNQSSPSKKLSGTCFQQQ